MAIEINGRLGVNMPDERPIGRETTRTEPERPVSRESAGLASFRPDRMAALPGAKDSMSSRLALRRPDRPTPPADQTEEEEWNDEFFSSFFDWTELRWDDPE
jgi:hypothetical protein